MIAAITAITLVAMFLYSNNYFAKNPIANIFDSLLLPIQKTFTYANDKITGLSVHIGDIKQLRKQNEELSKKVDLLKKENAELLTYKEQDKELRNALNLKSQLTNYTSLGANVISADAGNWFYVFVIDRGTRDGIAVGTPVLTGSGLAGRVIEVGNAYSKVMSIIDASSAVSARISKTRDIAVVKGDISLKDSGLCILDYVPKETNLNEGDVIETSGLGNILPKGISIGEVKEVKQKSNGLGNYAIIKPFVNFEKLEEVLVLKGA